MRILIVGQGGREHALAWALARSTTRPELLIAPGNAGTAALGRNVPVRADDVEGLVACARRERVDLTIVGPEVPLVLGIVGRFDEEGLKIVGPSAAAARLEGSKAFAKAFMDRNGVPTAAHQTFQAAELDEALRFVRQMGAPVVVKTSGLAAGKGAIVCETLQEAEAALYSIMRDRVFGEAGDQVVIEEFMEGEEASIFVLTDGAHYVTMPSAQDHKRIGEGDTGPNTGGMGAYAPAPLVTGRMLTRICREVVEPTLAGMAAEGYPYRGFLYCGLMLDGERIRVVEFNCRLGDPEAQVLLPLIESDLVDVFRRLVEGRLREVVLEATGGAAACIVVASPGYPGDSPRGLPIRGLDAAAELEDVVVFHAGTSRDESGRIVTAGGRVLNVTATGESLAAALDRAYEAVHRIQIDGMQYRKDIGHRGLARLQAIP
jgi:phosphoribosylamine---glycine ligase